MTSAAPEASLAPLAPPADILVRHLGTADYSTTWEAMRGFTATRDARTADELWDVRHPPVYTLGVAGREAHVLRPNGIPVVRCDRGGQVTYHGPGQAVLYVLLDLRRLGFGARELVRVLESAVTDTLATYGLTAETREGAPGVYVNGAKIASLGLRIRSGCSYHGVALNVDMDLAPFRDIDPCGYPGQAVTRLADLADTPGGTDEAARRLTGRLTDSIRAAQSRRSKS